MRLREKDLAVRSPRRSLSSVWGWDGCVCRNSLNNSQNNKRTQGSLLFPYRWTTAAASRRSTLLASARNLWTAWPTPKTSFTFSGGGRERKTSKVRSKVKWVTVDEKSMSNTDANVMFHSFRRGLQQRGLQQSDEKRCDGGAEGGGPG